MEVRRLAPGELEELAPLLAGHRYHDYRLYPRFSRADRTRVLGHEMEEAAKRGVVVAARGRGRPLAVASVESLAWDSAFFGLPMGRIGTLVAEASPDGGEALAVVLDAALEAAREVGLQHLAARADTEDLEAVQALEARGFRLVDCLVTYMFDCRRDRVAAIRRFNPIRHYRPGDREAVLAVAGQMFAAYAGRFARDPWLDAEACRRFYVQWVENACAGQMADSILVSVRQGRVVGFLTWRTTPSVFEATGIRIAGQGICGVLPEGTGAYPALVRAAIVEHRGEYDFAEMDTPIQHAVSQRVFQGVGARLARAKYTLHRSARGGA
jgi:dTDP-4-amino-4,6-dideoxy-D-galactose acyltransferase